jgi:hypothetical protein
MFKYIAFCFCFALTALYSSEPVNLRSFEHSFYSQNGEDGVIAKILQLTNPRIRYCVELGAGDGITMSNTYLLRLQGWDGLFLDRSYEDAKSKLYKEFITAENVNRLFEKYGVPSEFGVLSLDIHYNDFHIWNVLDTKYRPLLVVVAYNAGHAPDEDKVVKYRPFFCGDGTDYFGASILAFYHLGKAKGYSLIYADQTGSNLFFIRDDILRGLELTFTDMNQVEKLYRPPAYRLHPVEGEHRVWESSKENLLR